MISALKIIASMEVIRPMAVWIQIHLVVRNLKNCTFDNAFIIFSFEAVNFFLFIVAGSESDESDNESVKDKKTEPVSNSTPCPDKAIVENSQVRIFWIEKNIFKGSFCLKFINFQVDEDIIKKILICCVCLGDRSDDANEIIDCDGCGITVHEGISQSSSMDFCLYFDLCFLIFVGCYGVQDNASVSSSNSSCSTEPWFCEACRAGVDNPTCELCPNSGIQ